MGMGFSEVFLIMVIVAVVYGSTKLPGAGDLLGRWMREETPSEGQPGRWTTVDWLLVSTTLAIAVTLTVAVTKGR
jgi:hypothetical protein